MSFGGAICTRRHFARAQDHQSSEEVLTERTNGLSARLSVNSARIRKTLDRLAYASLVLDVCIAIITTLSVLDIGSNPQHLLFPINYLLTIVVVLSIIMFAVLLLLRAKERQAVKAIEKATAGS